jgi:hypothetical protein
MLEAMRTAFLMPSYDYRALARGLCRASGIWRAAVRLVACGLVTACGPREPALTKPGVSTVNPVGAPSPYAQRDAATRWEGFAELGTYRTVGARFLSRGHFAGRWKAEILVHPSAADAYASLSPSTRFSVGAVLVKKHFERDSNAEGPLFAMIKREPGFFPQGGDWEYLVTDPGGWIEDRGPLLLCARCHAEANADWVFGLRAEARR